MADDPQIPQLSDVIRAAVAARLVSVYTSIPATVVDYDEDTQTITAQINILGASYIDEFGNTNRVNIGPINRVPVCFPGTGAYSITWPLSQGDTVKLDFACGSIDRWMSLGGQGVDPMDDRRFAKDDAMAMPGLRAIPDVLTSAAFDSAAMVIGAPMIKLGSSAASEPPAINSELAAFLAVFTAIERRSLAMAAPRSRRRSTRS